MRLFYLVAFFSFIGIAFTQEVKNVSKSNFENAFNSKYLGFTNNKHFVLNYNQNVFRSDIKDIDEDKIAPKTVLSLVIFNSETNFEKTVVLDIEYKFQEILFAGLVDNKIRIIYVSRKGKGTILENFDLNGTPLDFALFSSEKKGNYIMVTDSSKFILHFTQESCYVYDQTLKNIDKFTFENQKIIEIKNYKEGFIILSKNNDVPELTYFHPNDDIKHEKISEGKTWVYKSPRISIDQLDQNKFYISCLIGKKDEHSGGWDFLDTRLDMNYRSKGVKLKYYDGWGNITKERSILFESNIVYGTNPNANSETTLGCTNLHNKGIIHHKNSLIILLEEQTVKIKETINPLTNTKKVNHSFKYNDIIFIKAEGMTSIQNFLIKACNLNMDENQFGSFHHFFHGNKLKIIYNQTYIREKKQKLLTASLDMYLDTESKVLNESFNQHGLNLVLNPTENYVKSKYFLALQTGYLDLTFVEE
jgi:hypothetical protein